MQKPELPLEQGLRMCLRQALRCSWSGELASKVWGPVHLRDTDSREDEMLLRLGNGTLDWGLKSLLIRFGLPWIGICELGKMRATPCGPRKASLFHGKATTYLFTCQMSFKLGRI